MSRKPMPSCTDMFTCQPAAALSWKINVIMAGVGATFLAVLGLVKWTVDRVDQIEARAVDAAEVRAAKTASAHFDAIRATLTEDRRAVLRELLAAQAQLPR